MITNVPSLSQRVFYFLGIGGTAALVHILIVLNLVTHFELDPLIANVIGFLTAFNISFIGHKYLTFSDLANEAQLSLPHFFIVAASAGMLNEFAYYLLLTYTSLHYIAALILVLGIASFYSYTLSRFWACR